MPAAQAAFPIPISLPVSDAFWNELDKILPNYHERKGVAAEEQHRNAVNCTGRLGIPRRSYCVCFIASLVDTRIPLQSQLRLLAMNV